MHFLVDGILSHSYFLGFGDGLQIEIPQISFWIALLWNSRSCSTNLGMANIENEFHNAEQFYNGSFLLEGYAPEIFH